MIEFDASEACYYIRLETRAEYLNLLFLPGRGESANEALTNLFGQFGKSCGTITYFDVLEECLVTLRSKSFKGLKVFLYDNEAPYQGLYMGTQFSELLETE